MNVNEFNMDMGRGALSWFQDVAFMASGTNPYTTFCGDCGRRTAAACRRTELTVSKYLVLAVRTLAPNTFILLQSTKLSQSGG